MTPIIGLPIVMLLAHPPAIAGYPISSTVAVAAQRSPAAQRGPIAASARRAALSFALSAEMRRTPRADDVSDGWMERHPVWTGLLVGAAAGAAYGALSCREGCFPLGQGWGAAVSAGYGAGFGALAGWVVGVAKRDSP